MTSELHSVEIPLIKTLQRLGWEFISQNKNLALRGGSEHEVFLKEYVIEAILKYNRSKGLTKEDAETIYRKLNRLENNEEFYSWLKGEKSQKLKDGKSVSVEFYDRWNPENNRFSVTQQFTCTITKPEDAKKNIRPDLVLFLNGIPLTVVECKFLGTEGSTYGEGIKQLERYQRTTPKLFYPNVFNITTDGLKLKYGATGATEQYYLEWKHDDGTPAELKNNSDFQTYAKENRVNYNPFIDIQVFGLLNRENYIDLITNFVVFETKENQTVKMIARFQQVRAVNKIVDRVLEGKMHSGLIWHTQGSGKSLTMLFASWKLRTLPQLKNPTILIVVDRVDLDEQISGTFEAVKLPNTTRASSIRALRDKLKNDTREVIITTIFKFDEMRDILIDRKNVIVLIDEAHRTQEGKNAAQMRETLQNGFLFGFTGTPIDKLDKNTHRNFGLKPDGTVERYMDLYNIKDAIDDKATVPVHYQLRNEKWHINSDHIDKLIDAEFSHLSEEELDVLKDKGSSYGKTFMMNPERLKTIAEDIVSHYKAYVEPNGYKAQIVAFSREACVIIKEHIDRLLGEEYSDVVYSPGQNDRTPLRKYHKSKQEIRNCIKVFKQKDSKLKFIIVQSMLLTGFDAPIEQVMYLDRPLKDHSLLQAIARTNRPYPNKKCGIIIDYCGILKNLKKALNFDESDVTDCLIDFDKLKEQLPKHLRDFHNSYAASENKSPYGIADFLHKSDNLISFKEAYKGVQISYETLAPDPFVLDYTKEYVEATKLKLIVDSILIQLPPDVSQYLAKTREIIQAHIDIGDINKQAPVFVVDDNYLKRLDGTALNEKDKELTLENRLRTVLRIKADDLPVYKTLQERLEQVIKRRDEDLEDSYDLLRQIMLEFNEAQVMEGDDTQTMGERAITQMLKEHINNDELVAIITQKLNAAVLRETEGFTNWQIQDSVVARIRRDIIIELAQLSKVHSAITKETIDYSKFAEEVMKYILQYY